MADQLKTQIKVTIDNSPSAVKKLQSELDAIGKQLKLNVAVATKQDKVNKSSASGLQDQVKLNQQNLNIEKQRNVEVGNLNKKIVNIGKDGGITKITKEFQTGAARATTEIHKLNKETQELEFFSAMTVENFNAQSKALSDSSKLISRIKIFENDNPKAAKLYKDQFDGFKESLKDLGDPVIYQDINRQFQGIQKEAESLGKTGRSVFGELKHNFLKVANWAVLTAGVASAIRQIKSMFTNVVELDKAMTDIRYVTGETYEETLKLADSYEKLAQKLGATTIETMTSANEWLRQGKTVAETNKLIETAMVFSKIAALDSATATQYLTSAMKGYNLTAEESILIADRLSTVDMESATSAGGLAEAMSRTANSAKIAGVSMDKLISYLAVVGEVTQKQMSSIGESFKTIFSRMGNVKLGIYMDDDGEDLSDVEKILSSLNIKLRDSSKSFRNFGDVLDEVGSRWESFNQVEQSAIANAFAGVRQRENFLVLMDNYSTSLKYAESSMNSAGTAMEKFGFYQESIEAKTNRLTQSFESLSYNTINSGWIKGFLDLSNAIIRTTDKVGLFNIVFLTLAGIIGTKTEIATVTGAKALLTKLIPALAGSSAAATALSAALSIMIPVAIILGGIAVFNHLSKTLERQQEKVTSLKTQYEDIAVQIKALEDKEKASFLDTPLTDREKARLEFLNEYKDSLEDAMRLEQTKETKMAFFGVGDSIPFNKGLSGEYGDIRDSAAYYTDKINKKTADQIKESGIPGKVKDVNAVYDGLIKKQAELFEYTELLNDELEKPLDVTTKKQLQGELDLTKVSMEDLEKALNILRDTGLIELEVTPESIDSIKESEDAIIALSDALDSFLDKESLVTSVQNEAKESHKISFDNIQKLLKAYPELESVLHDYLAGLASTSDVMKEVDKAYDTDLKNYKNTIIEKQKTDETFYSNVLQLSSSKVNEFSGQYGIDLKNYKSLAEAKFEVEKQLIQELGVLWSVYYNATTKAYTEEYRQLQLRAADGDKDAQKLLDKLNVINRAKDAIDEIAYKGIDVSLGKIGSSSSKSKSEDPLKALDAIYNKRLQHSKEYIEDRKFYDDWGADNEIAAWGRVKAYTEEYYRQGKISAELYADAIREINKNIYSAQQEFEKQQRNIVQTISDVEDEIVKLYEREFSKLREELQSWYDVKKDAAEQDYKNQKQKYQDDLDEFTKYINDKKNALNKAYDEDNFNTTLTEKQKELADIQTLINELSLAAFSGDRVAKVKRETLLKDLADKQKEIDKLVADRSRDIQLDALNNALDDYNDYISDKQDVLNTEYESELKQLERLYKKKLERLEEEYSREKLYSKARKELMSGEYTELIALFDEYQKDQGAGWSALGGILQREFIDKLKEASRLLREMDEDSFEFGTAGSNGGNSTNGKVVYADSNGNAPEGTKVGDTVITKGGTYKVVPPNTSGAGYNPATGLWSKKIYAQGGVADFTDLIQVDGSKTRAETIFNSTDSKKLYDLIHGSTDLTGVVLRNLIPVLDMPLTNRVNKLPNSIEIGNLINIEGNADQSTVKQIQDTARDALSEFARKINSGNIKINKGTALI